MKILDIFSIKYSLHVLFACEETANVTKVARRLNLKPASIYPAINKLVELEVLNSETITKRGFRRNLSLTEKGKKILEKLKEVEALL